MQLLLVAPLISLVDWACRPNVAHAPRCIEPLILLVSDRGLHSEGNEKQLVEQLWIVASECFAEAFGVIFGECPDGDACLLLDQASVLRFRAIG